MAEDTAQPGEFVPDVPIHFYPSDDDPVSNPTLAYGQAPADTVAMAYQFDDQGPFSLSFLCPLMPGDLAQWNLDLTTPRPDSGTYTLIVYAWTNSDTSPSNQRDFTISPMHLGPGSHESGKGSARPPVAPGRKMTSQALQSPRITATPARNGDTLSISVNATDVDHQEEVFVFLYVRFKPDTPSASNKPQTKPVPNGKGPLPTLDGRSFPFPLFKGDDNKVIGGTYIVTVAAVRAKKLQPPPYKHAGFRDREQLKVDQQN